MQTVDSEIAARWVIPVEPARAVWEDHSVLIDQGRITAIVPTVVAARDFRPRTRTVLERHALIPGLVNAHTHVAMSLFRGLADDLPLHSWLNDHIWPAERRSVTHAFCRDAALLSLAELTRSGVTCFNDMYFFPDAVGDAARAAGLRASVGIVVIDFPTAWAENVDEYLRKGLALRDRWRSSDLITMTLAPHAPYTVSDKALERVRTLSDELDLPVHMHIHETAHEVDEAVRLHGERPLERLRKLGLITDRLIAVHMTALDDEEIALLAARGAHVVHCPESNLKIASGLCPVARLARAGVNVAIGTDGAASNNDQDMLGELRTAALLAKGVSGDPTAIPASEALEMATLKGARALGLGDEIGSLRQGKAADLVAIDLGRLATQPVYDPVSQIVYAASRDQVTHLWVAGRALLIEGKLQMLDEGAILETAQARATEIRASEPLAAPSHHER